LNNSNVQPLEKPGSAVFEFPHLKFGEWLSLVEHLVRDQGVGGSNPLSPTNSFSTTCRIDANLRAHKDMVHPGKMGKPVGEDFVASFNQQIERGDTQE
jgi:hypothetical protein